MSESSDPWSGRLRGVLLLGGGVAMSELRRGVDRPILDLPIEPELSILDHWCREAESLAAACRVESLPVRVLVDGEASSASQVVDGRARVSLERDRSEYRGTGGTLRDACEAYDDGDIVLVAPAHQVLLEPLSRLAAILAACPCDAAILASDAGVPAALIAVRVAATRGIRAVGFVDFKEQALPALARHFDVRVVRRSGVDAVPVRTLDGYVDAVRAHHRRRSGADPAEGPFAEHWQSAFGLVEPGATVSADARVHDSVILRGARVASGAVLVRSLVCPGAEVASGEVVADGIVTTRAGHQGKSS